MIVNPSPSSLSSPNSDTSFLLSPDSQMSPSNLSSVNCTPFPSEHKEFYSENSNVTFLVENTYFKVDRFFFQRDSHVFRGIFERVPSYRAEAIPLWGVTSLDFERFLRVLYPTDFNKHDATTVGEWTSILDISARWAFKSIFALAVKQLNVLASPVDKIVLGRKYKVTEWLREAYRAVCERDHTLTIEEGERLGMSEVIKIWQASRAIRESARLVAPRRLYSVIEETFGLGIVPEEDGVCKHSHERELEDDDGVVDYRSGTKGSVYEDPVEECREVPEELTQKEKMFDPVESSDMLAHSSSSIFGRSGMNHYSPPLNTGDIVHSRSDFYDTEAIQSKDALRDTAIHQTNFYGTLFPDEGSEGEKESPTRMSQTSLRQQSGKRHSKKLRKSGV